MSSESVIYIEDDEMIIDNETPITEDMVFHEYLLAVQNRRDAQKELDEHRSLKKYIVDEKEEFEAQEKKLEIALEEKKDRENLIWAYIEENYNTLDLLNY